ncbi:extracellular solute-binding protein [Paenibacillus sp. LMG 31461]|uniref:Extracellular solute-binding protein n=1 Tax=Paenibacillus plantarum TaxID=2654975 RepID=A0ABX1XCH3_9BACL|nr:extracellular solute-binding protein [Paenibacillus plantarum]NOU66119.1 extracellular solute-binding protein [Paenibacillus plantarum]
MQKRNKTILLALTSMLAAGSALAGCSKEQGNESADQPATAKAQKRGNISVMVYDRGRVPADEGTYEKNRWTEWINKNGPVDATFVPILRNNPGEKLNVLLASGTAPDFIQDYDALNKNAWYTSKQLMPLDDLIEKYSVEYKALLKKYPILRKLGTQDDGKLYEAGAFVPSDINWVFLARTDWLKKLNLEVPKTTEELYAVAKAFTENDPDGNGKKDTFGMSLGGGFNQNIFNWIFGVPGAGLALEDGKMVYPWKQTEAIAEFKKRLYQDGLIDKDFAADANGEKAKRDFVNGKLGFYTMQWADVKSTFEAFKKNVPEGNVIPIMLPRSQFGQFAPALSGAGATPGVINAKAKDPISVIKYIDFLNKEETVKALKWGIEGEHYKLDANGCPAPIDLEKNKKEKSWNGDYSLVSNPTDATLKCDPRIMDIDKSTPVGQEYTAILETARKTYVNPQTPIPGFFLNTPALPNDLNMINQSVSKLGDEYSKAIVTKDYSVQKATQTAKDMWTKAGGGKIEEWYNTYYNKNKDKIVTVMDIYEKK